MKIFFSQKLGIIQAVVHTLNAKFQNTKYVPQFTVKIKCCVFLLCLYCMDENSDHILRTIASSPPF